MYILLDFPNIYEINRWMIWIPNADPLFDILDIFHHRKNINFFLNQTKP